MTKLTEQQINLTNQTNQLLREIIQAFEEADLTTYLAKLVEYEQFMTSLSEWDTIVVTLDQTNQELSDRSLTIAQTMQQLITEELESREGEPASHDL